MVTSVRKLLSSNSGNENFQLTWNFMGFKYGKTPWKVSLKVFQERPSPSLFHFPIGLIPYWWLWAVIDTDLCGLLVVKTFSAWRMKPWGLVNLLVTVLDCGYAIPYEEKLLYMFYKKKPFIYIFHMKKNIWRKKCFTLPFNQHNT